MISGLVRPVLTLALAAAPLIAMAQGASPEDRTPVGFWVRLTYSEASDEAMWVQLEEAGATDLFVETFYHGLVIYPGSQVTGQRPELQGRDPLAWAIERGAERGIRVHAWVHALRLGPDYERFPQTPPHPWMAEGQGWRTLGLDGSPHGEFIVSAAVPEVRAIARRVCAEIVETHPGIAGINLDYIRWPEGGEFWYEPVNVQQYIDAGGADPRTDRSEENIRRFRQHSADQVTSLVREIGADVHALDPGVLLSAAFFPGIDERDRWFKAQDWPAWVRERLLDVATPMCYAYALGGITREVTTVTALARPAGVPVWAGLAVQRGTEHPRAVEQLDVVRDRGLSGVVFFSHGWVAQGPGEFGEIGAWFRVNRL